jgi:hypothetical protein
MEIIQIVPYLPPAVSGVGDYALLLANELRRSHNISTSFIVCDSEYEAAPETSAFTVTKVSTHSAPAFTNLLQEMGDKGATVLLQYVGYGYQKRGAPLWLVNGLEAWRSASRRRRLITMFHELFAFGPPWRSSFWTSPLQRRLVARLARISDSCVTNIRRYARRLETWRPPDSGSVEVLPVFSNVEESENCARNRRNEMVIFGGRGWREAAYTNSIGDLIKVCRLLDIRRIHDIGPPLSSRFELPINIERHGVLPPPVVKEIMQNALVGFFTYPTPFLGKSTIFAAYASHGLVPITGDENDETNEDHLQLNSHFLTCGALASNTAAIPVVGEQVHAWYVNHRLAVQAQKYAAMLMENGGD